MFGISVALLLIVDNSPLDSQKKSYNSQLSYSPLELDPREAAGGRRAPAAAAGVVLVGAAFGAAAIPLPRAAPPAPPIGAPARASTAS